MAGASVYMHIPNVRPAGLTHGCPDECSRHMFLSLLLTNACTGWLRITNMVDGFQRNANAICYELTANG